MSLSLREKQNVYYELGQFLRSGAAPTQALESLLSETPGGTVRRFFQGLLNSLKRGDTLPEAFAAVRPAIGEMELAVVSAASQGGRLDAAFRYLSSYFENLDHLRRELRKGAAWPLFQLHFGVLVLGLPALFTSGGGVGAYLGQTFGFLLALYAAAAVCWILGAAWVRAATRSVPADRALRAVPLFGGLRRNTALGRFCAAYEIGLSAGVNVTETLLGAARASGSALLQGAATGIVPQVRAGGQVGALLAGTGAFPKELLRAMRLGEDTGHLDEELRRATQDYEAAALRKMRALGSWLPKFIYIAVAGFLGYQVVKVWSGYMNVINTMSEGL